ncbi:MAG: YraN family protein [Candidatus Sumerlaeia bacterium]|nr:YraN family protein [Candidatus Sumerlaeia bacterium]
MAELAPELLGEGGAPVGVLCVQQAKQVHGLLRQAWWRVGCRAPHLTPRSTDINIIGAWGQAWALWYLQRAQNAALIQANWRTREFELDLIVQLPREVLFVEVKTRLLSEVWDVATLFPPERRRRLAEGARQYYAQLPPFRPEARICALVVAYQHQTPGLPRIDYIPRLIEAVDFR